MSGVLAIIGGSGLYDVESLEDVEERWVSTPYGAPSDAVIRGRMKGTDTTVLFLPRHGRGHRIPRARSTTARTSAPSSCSAPRTCSRSAPSAR